jgi:hypothetical protein
MRWPFVDITYVKLFAVVSLTYLRIKIAPWLFNSV